MIKRLKFKSKFFLFFHWSLNIRIYNIIFFIFRIFFFILSRYIIIGCNLIIQSIFIIYLSFLYLNIFILCIRILFFRIHMVLTCWLNNFIFSFIDYIWRAKLIFLLLGIRTFIIFFICLYDYFYLRLCLIICFFL